MKHFKSTNLDIAKINMKISTFHMHLSAWNQKTCCEKLSFELFVSFDAELVFNICNRCIYKLFCLLMGNLILTPKSLLLLFIIDISPL